MAELARFVIFDGIDPFTLPQTKVVWVNSSLPGIKVPVLKYKRMHSKIMIIVEGPEEDEVRGQLNQCINSSAIKAMIVGFSAAFISGGTAALTTAMLAFVTSLDGCVEAVLSRAVDITAHIDNPTHWDNDWKN